MSKSARKGRLLVSSVGAAEREEVGRQSSRRVKEAVLVCVRDRDPAPLCSAVPGVRRGLKAGRVSPATVVFKRMRLGPAMTRVDALDHIQPAVIVEVDQGRPLGERLARGISMAWKSPCP